MIQLQPQKRLSAAEYLKQWRGKAFPDSFYSFLHQYIASVNEARPDDSLEDRSMDYCRADAKIKKIHSDFGQIAVALGMKDLVTNQGKTIVFKL